MRCPLLGLLLLFGCQTASPTEVPIPAPIPGRGALIIMGGGRTLPLFTQRALQLARGELSIVAVLPQASRAEGRGQSSVEMWLEGGAAEALLVDGVDSETAQTLLARADIIWMPGGSQSRLMEELEQMGLIAPIQKAFAAGAVVGGTSAGAAVMSAEMITGLEEPERLEVGVTDTAPGLGLWPGVLIDQHFFRRKRFNRLLSAVLDAPQLLGVGIGESTAVVLQRGLLEVLGVGNVMLIDAREAQVAEAEAGRSPRAASMEIEILRAVPH